MCKRICGFLMAVVILVSVISVGAVPVSAASDFNTSDECIRILKAEEGFVKYPYWDYAQYSVGYGTRCPDDKLDYYLEHGISEAEAEELLRIYLDAFEEDVNKDLIDKFGLTMTQNQFDALVMFSYNCGTGWIYTESSEFRSAIINGATGNEIIDRFSRWCNAGGQIKTFLLKRRLCEANMYLNGEYSRTVPENYAYVLYDANGGVSSPNVQGYDASLTSTIIPVPTYEGYNFAGWYTAKVGGEQVTVLDASVRNMRLYAHWTDAEGNDPNVDNGTPGVWITVEHDDVNLREGPGTSYKVIGTANRGEQFKITETKTGGGYTWGKYPGGWICLDFTNYESVKDNGATEQPVEPETPNTPETPETPENPTTPETPTTPEVEEKITGTVKVSECLRVRSGPGTGYSITGYLYNGDKVTILERKMVGHMEWGKISNGWISLEYVKLDEKQEQKPAEKPVEPEKEETTTPPAQQPTTPTTWTGKVNVGAGEVLRVRNGAGTSYSVTGYLSHGVKVTITEKKTVGSTVWGKISNGWISLDYVTLDEKQEQKPAEKPVEPEKEETTTPPAQQPTTPTTWTGKVSVGAGETLRIRSGAGTSYKIVGYLNRNDKVTVTEKKTVGSTVWGKISNGWISLDYVVFDTADSGNNTGSSNTTTPAKQMGTVNVKDCLRIRTGPGTSYAVAGYLNPKERVEILSTKTVNGVVWGQISKGWISMTYVTLDKSTSGNQTTTQTVSKTVTADCLRIRSGAGTGYSIVGYLYKNAQVQILETKTVNGTVWGKTSKGWISMDYVR